MRNFLLVRAAFSLLPLALAACGSATPTGFGGGDGGTGKGTFDASGPVIGNFDAGPIKGSSGDGGSGKAGTGSSCSNGGQTTVSGKIFDPAGKNPLYGIVVYATTATTLPALPTGASCATCDSLYEGIPIVASAVTDATGSFTLTGTPAGSHVSIVAQVGKWRRLFSLNVTACTSNPQPDGTLTLPKNGSEGDIPEIAVSTGGADTLECMLGRVGLDPAEYTGGAGGSGHIHIFQGGSATGSAAPQVSGSSATSGASLWDQQSDLMPYDVVLLSCEGQDVTRTAAELSALQGYANAGGRVFMSHYHYDWLNEGPFSSDNLADWSSAGSTAGAGSTNGTIITTLPSGSPFIKGQALHDWLSNVGALSSGTLPINSPRYDAVVTAANTPSQEWITAPNPSGGSNPSTMYFSFDTPVGGDGHTDDAGNPEYCGRAVFSDLHVSSAAGGLSSLTPPCPDYYTNSAGLGICLPAGSDVTPSGCATGALSPQEKALEFMLFDLSSCVVPDQKAPPPPPPSTPPQ